MTEMLIPAKYAEDIDYLRNGHHGWHGLRHRIAWAVAPKCIRSLMIAGLMVATHPDDDACHRRMAPQHDLVAATPRHPLHRPARAANHPGRPH